MKNWKYDIYLGCRDKTTRQEKISREYLEEILNPIFVRNKVGFSITKQAGGYIHEDGKYIIEESIKITLIGHILKRNIDKFVAILKDKINQEHILLVKKEVVMDYLINNEEKHEKV